MTRVVLSIGSNLGDRMGRLQSVVDGLGERVRAVSPVYETDPWGGVDQGPFLNAVVVAEDPRRDAHDWLRFGQDLERAADRVRDRKWGPRTLDVDLVRVQQRQPDGALTEVVSSDSDPTLPHPLAHLRAFVLIPGCRARRATARRRHRAVCRRVGRRARRDRTGRRAPDRPGAALMTRPAPGDLAVTVVVTAVLGYLLVLGLYRWFPPLTVWTDCHWPRSPPSKRVGRLRAGQGQRR